LINEKLRQTDINVVVDICDPTEGGNGGYLYDATKIDSLFDDHEIIQIDVAYLKVIKTDLLSFRKD
jgi:hypothetical protein